MTLRGRSMFIQKKKKKKKIHEQSEALDPFIVAKNYQTFSSDLCTRRSTENSNNKSKAAFFYQIAAQDLAKELSIDDKLETILKVIWN